MPATCCSSTTTSPADRIGVRFAASGHNTVIANNEFAQDKDAGLWAVRAEPDARGSAISVRDNHFNGDRTGIVAGNVAMLIERNEFASDPEGAIHLVGAGAVIRGNHIDRRRRRWASSPRTRARPSSRTTSSITSTPTASWCAARPTRWCAPTACTTAATGSRSCSATRAARARRSRQHHHRAEVQRHRRHRRLADPAPQPGAAAARLRAARDGFPAARRPEGRLAPLPREQQLPRRVDRRGLRSRTHGGAPAMRETGETQILPSLTLRDPRLHLLDDTWLLTIFAVLFATAVPWLVSGLDDRPHRLRARPHRARRHPRHARGAQPRRRSRD